MRLCLADLGGTFCVAKYPVLWLGSTSFLLETTLATEVNFKEDSQSK
jgi:hypothetical protein